MNTNTYTFTDDNTGATFTGDIYDAEDTVRGWFPDATPEVTALLDDLFADTRHLNDTTAAALGLTVE